MIERVIVAGGGTGGHLFPGIAVVEELRRRVPSGSASRGLDVRFVGTPRGIESRVIPAMGETLDTLDVTPLKGRSFTELLGSLARLPSALGRAVSILRQHRPDLVLGVGGYASGPMLMAASTLGIKTAILEQNARAGLTNRLLARRVGRAYLTFEETAPLFGERARVVGNPVRRAFVDASRHALVDPRGFDARARRILVIGGSQGAKRLNEVVPEALAKLDLTRGDGGRPIEIVHQTGTAMHEVVAARYRALGLEATVVPFIDDVAAAYASASFVICRAGASTLAELAAIGRPAILIPFPFAADDHQGKNAESFERAGAAFCLREAALDAESLAERARELLEDASLRRSMAEAMRGRGRPDAAAAIVDDLLAWIDGEAPLEASRSTDEFPPVVEEREGDTPASDDDPGIRSAARTSGIERVAHPSIDFREGRALRMARARASVPRLVVEPVITRRPLALSN